MLIPLRNHRLGLLAHCLVLLFRCLDDGISLLHSLPQLRHCCLVAASALTSGCPQFITSLLQISDCLLSVGKTLARVVQLVLHCTAALPCGRGLALCQLSRSLRLKVGELCLEFVVQRHHHPLGLCQLLVPVLHCRLGLLQRHVCHGLSHGHVDKQGG